MGDKIIICDIAYDINLRLKNKTDFLNSKCRRKILKRKKERKRRGREKTLARTKI